MTPDYLEEILICEDFDPREMTEMELEQAYREYCASQGVWLLNEERMLEFAKHGDESHGC